MLLFVLRTTYQDDMYIEHWITQNLYKVAKHFIYYSFKNQVYDIKHHVVQRSSIKTNLNTSPLTKLALLT